MNTRGDKIYHQACVLHGLNFFSLFLALFLFNITASYGRIGHVFPDLPESLFAVSLHGKLLWVLIFREYYEQFVVYNLFAMRFPAAYDKSNIYHGPDILLIANHIAYACNCATILSVSLSR
jgi:hypothetical protein